MKILNKALFNPLCWQVKVFTPFFLLFLLSAPPSFAGNSVTVVYPVYHNDSDRIISEIRRGINERLVNSVSEIALDTAQGNDVMQQKIGVLPEDDTVIALTSYLGDQVRASGFRGQVIEGVADNTDTKKSTLSVGIEPSPQVYVGLLTKLRPGIRKIYYLTSEDVSKSGDKVIRLDDVSEGKRVDLATLKIKNINEVMHALNEIFDMGDPARDALWIPDQVLSMSNNTVLKYVLRESWKKSFIVFTDSPDAVLRGLLFCLLPDYQSYGNYLAKLSKDLVEQNDYPVTESIQYYDDVYLMVNQRFLIHTGLNINRSQINKYKIMVPAK